MNQIGHQDPPANPANDEALGWEGHVNIPRAPALTRLLTNWPELRTGLAFSVVFVAGACVGGALIASLHGARNRTARE